MVHITGMKKRNHFSFNKFSTLVCFYSVLVSLYYQNISSVFRFSPTPFTFIHSFLFFFTVCFIHFYNSLSLTSYFFSFSFLPFSSRLFNLFVVFFALLFCLFNFYSLAFAITSRRSMRKEVIRLF